MRSLRLNHVLLMLITCLPLVATAQVAITGRVTGIVTDKQGAAIEGATVTVQGPSLMHPKTVLRQQAGGAYLVEQIPPGEYQIACSETGFETYLEHGVVLTAGFTATVNVTMQVGNTELTVDVVGTGPVVDVQGSSPPTTFETSMLQNIPSGHDPWSTVSQVPAVTSSTFDVGGNQSAQQSSMSVHGSKTTESVYSFNGLNLDWPGGSGGSTAFYVDYDSFEEFQVVTDAAPCRSFSWRRLHEHGDQSPAPTSSMECRRCITSLTPPRPRSKPQHSPRLPRAQSALMSRTPVRR